MCKIMWRVALKGCLILSTFHNSCCSGFTSRSWLQYSSASKLFKLRGGSSTYDITIIGGGSGGNACAKEAAKLGKSVAILDYVKPSPQGTQWGLGGTCVNVGCIPKKLMHEAARIGFDLKFSGDAYGWKNDNQDQNQNCYTNYKTDNFHRREVWRHNWSKLVQTVQDYIHSINFKTENKLRNDGIDYYNDIGEFIDNKSIRLKHSNKVLTSDAFVIAVGGRPQKLNIPGGELVITSDDIFSIPSLTSRPSNSEPPRILVIGGSYVGLECAGFLTGLGAEVTLLHRSPLLPGFDRTCTQLVSSHMKEHGTRFISNSQPDCIMKYKDYLKSEKSVMFNSNHDHDEKNNPKEVKDEQLFVKWSNKHSNEKEQQGGEGVFDIVLSAVGRAPDVQALGLQNTGVELHPETNKILTSNQIQSSAPNIYAIGDVVQDSPQLTPVAVKAGQNLARHLASNTPKCPIIDYEKVSTTVFTPLEYSSCGLSEEAAMEKHGIENIDIYHSSFEPLEEVPLDISHDQVHGYCKAIVLRQGAIQKNYRKNEQNVGSLQSSMMDLVIGLHYVGPHAGEVMQGFAVAMKMGMTLYDLQSTIGIHPTSAENMVKLKKHYHKQDQSNENGDAQHDIDTTSPPALDNC